MFHPLIRSLVKVAVASLIVGTILTHFGITPEMLVKEFGFSFDRIEDLARRGLSWAVPSLMVGAMACGLSVICGASVAIAVVRYLISKGISPQHLVAAGFGEFQPLDPADGEEAFSRNRRIELKLTER